MRGRRRFWRRLRRWWALGLLPAAFACDGGVPRDPGPGALAPEEDGEVPPPRVHAPPLPLAVDVIDGRFGAPPEALDVSIDAGGGVWVASPAGLDVRPPGKAFFSRVALARTITAVGGMDAGAALVGHDEGPLSLVHVAPDGSAAVVAVALEGYVHEIRAVDSGARALVAGALGLAVVESDGSVTALRPAEPPSQELRAVAVGPDGAAWFASLQQLRRIPGTAAGDLSGAIDARVDLVPGQDDRTVALDVCPGGDVWAATLGHGVFHLSADGEPLAHLERSGILPQDHVLAVACDPAGGVWLGTSWGGLVRLHLDGTIDYHTRDAGLPGDSIRAIVAANEGAGRAIWFATEAGVAVYRGP